MSLEKKSGLYNLIVQAEINYNKDNDKPIERSKDRKGKTDQEYEKLSARQLAQSKIFLLIRNKS